MQEKDTTSESEERRHGRDRVYAALDWAYNSIQRAEEAKRAAAKLLDDAHRILKETRWTGARRERRRMPGGHARRRRPEASQRAVLATARGRLRPAPVSGVSLPDARSGRPVRPDTGEAVGASGATCPTGSCRGLASLDYACLSIAEMVSSNESSPAVRAGACRVSRRSR